MKSKSKNVLSMTVMVLFTLSVCYFAMLSPTSAWFYQSNQLQDTFVFGHLDVTLPPEDPVKTELILRGGTCFADKGEIKFDDAVGIITVPAQNVGTVPARVYVTYINNPPHENKGLRYFFVGEEEGGKEVSFKTEIDKMLVKGGMTLVDYGVELPKPAYTASSVGLLENYQKNGYVVVEPGKTVNVKIAVWIDYDDGDIKYASPDSSTSYTNLGASFKLSATQNTDGAFDVNTRQIIKTIS